MLDILLFFLIRMMCVSMLNYKYKLFLEDHWFRYYWLVYYYWMRYFHDAANFSLTDDLDFFSVDAFMLPEILYMHLYNTHAIQC